jgi:UDP-glucose 6-dehydrogenase
MKKLIILSFILIGCQTKAAKDKRVDMKTMQTVVWQLMQADEYYTRVSVIDSTWKIDTV